MRRPRPPATPPDFALECALDGPVAGVDEAGRGPWAGPVVAGAAVLDPADLPNGIADSKTLSRARREALYDALAACARIGVGIASVAEIDRLNILGATMLAMRRAVDDLGVMPGHVLVDGNRLPALDCPATAVVRGDARCVSIAAASIVAKVTRDRIMADLARAHPAFGWDHNAGYGTAEHRAALDAHGVTPHHRRSFAPVAARLNEV
jgi:ribonuclease HII